MTNLSQSQTGKIGLGTVQFGLDYGISNAEGQTSSEEVARIIQYCSVQGIDVLDTAFGYGNSEDVLGQNELADFKIVTKYLSPLESGISIEDQLSISLRKLNVDSVYALISHNPSSLFTNKSEWETLKRIKESGRVKKIGMSFSNPGDINEIKKAGFIPDLVQAPFNYFDHRFMSGLSELKNLYGTEIHTRSVYLQGLFFMDVNNLPDFFDPVKHALTAVQKENQGLATQLLKFAIDQNFIDKVIIGVNNLDQLKNNLNNLRESTTQLVLTNHQIPSAILDPSKWPKK